jgi:hypothetical protein
MPPNPGYSQSGWIKSEPAGQRTNMGIATYSIRQISALVGRGLQVELHGSCRLGVMVPSRWLGGLYRQPARWPRHTTVGTTAYRARTRGTH